VILGALVLMAIILLGAIIVAFPYQGGAGTQVVMAIITAGLCWSVGTGLYEMWRAR